MRVCVCVCAARARLVNCFSLMRGSKLGVMAGILRGDKCLSELTLVAVLEPIAEVLSSRKV